MGMKPRQVSAPTMASRTRANENILTKMISRFIATQKITPRTVISAITNHFRYNEVGVAYNQAFVTYNYSNAQGNIVPRDIATTTMKGRY
jgi:hypothetical protein